MNDACQNTYNPRKKLKVLLVLNDMIADMISDNEL